ncbi:MAG: TlpA disulfide reductase family protein [Candidatus Bathyarchaeia archaeon]|nr:TlpA family protein disulfide reductase [Candidatus Bathyarchaeota archaeon]
MKVKLWVIVFSLILIASVIAAIVSWFTLYSLLSRAIILEKDLSGILAPEFSLYDLNGNTLKLSDFKGKIVILDFMATWCGPCRMQIPHLNFVREKYGDSVILISISIDPNHDSEGILKEFLNEYPYANWIWARDTANLRGVYGVTAIPTLVIIDREGYIRFRHVGLTPSSTLIQEIDKILRGS